MNRKILLIGVCLILGTLGVAAAINAIKSNTLTGSFTVTQPTPPLQISWVAMGASDLLSTNPNGPSGTNFIVGTSQVYNLRIGNPNNVQYEGLTLDLKISTSNSENLPVDAVNVSLWNATGYYVSSGAAGGTSLRHDKINLTATSVDSTLLFQYTGPLKDIAPNYAAANAPVAVYIIKFNENAPLTSYSFSVVVEAIE